jgi:SAM-dependent methyltransferase
MIKTINYDGQIVPEYISKGHHSRFIQPLALEVCKGLGLDIGCNREEWKLPGSFGIDPAIPGCTWDAFNLPFNKLDVLREWDYIFSSHCLEHLPDYMKALRLWTSVIKPGGTLFLYLPHYNCKHWRPHVKMSSSVHYHQFYPCQMQEIFEELGYTNIFTSDCDLAYSFAIMGTK